MNNAAARLSKIFQRLREEGYSSVAARGAQKLFEWRQARAYQQWVKQHGTIGESERRYIEGRVAGMRSTPLLSVIMPVYNIDEVWLRRCIDSVLAQIYSNWELCVADDHSTLPHVRRVLEEYARKDPRIKVAFREENGHISAASNSAIELASGDFVILLDHDDELTEDALYWVAAELNDHPECDMIYSDEDMIDARGRRYWPKFKPDWSRDLFYSLNLITHLSAYRTELVRQIGGFRVGYEGSQDYDLALRIIEKTTDERIRHIPRILYHWRAIPGSVALNLDEKPYAHERARDAIRDHLSRSGIEAEVSASAFSLHRVKYPADPARRVRVIVFNTTAADKSTLAYWQTFDSNPKARVVFSDSANAPELNRLAESEISDILCFVDARLTPHTDDWLTEIVGTCGGAGIGVVGGKVIDSSSRVVAGGVVFGAGKAHVAFEGFLSETAGTMGRNLFIGDYSALSMHCLAVTRGVFEQVGGFSESVREDLIGIDLCLRIGRAGYRVVHDPFAVMEMPGARRSGSIEIPSDFRATWPEIVESDPFYNPNLDPISGRFEIKL